MSRRIAMLLCTLLAALVPSAALACSPTERPPGPSPTAVNRITEATVILHGKVIEHEPLGFTAKVQVISYLKGSGPSTVTINGWGSGVDCRPSLGRSDGGVGVEGIFFTTGDPAKALQTTGTVQAPLDTLIAQIKAESGQQPTPPQRTSLLALIGALTLVSVGAVLIAGYARRGRRS